MPTRAAAPGGPWLSALVGMKLRAWPGEDVVAVWVPGSVNTHLVSALAADVLTAASQDECSVESITATMLAEDGAQGGDVVPHSDAHAAVAAVVAALVQAGLLREVLASDPCSTPGLTWPR